METQSTKTVILEVFIGVILIIACLALYNSIDRKPVSKPDYIKIRIDSALIRYGYHVDTITYIRAFDKKTGNSYYFPKNQKVIVPNK